MYFKLALRNVKKSYRDYLIYFLTLTFSVCLFYTFNSFQAQQAVMTMNASQLRMIKNLASLMSIGSVFVAIVLAFLILYANNFLIRRRKKELGIYSILGMPKSKISMILVYETLIIGLVSLVSGMLLGIVISQVLTAVTANLFVVPLNYSFVFSPSATLLTIRSFTIIFVITMLFNTVVLNRYKLIDLLHAERKNAVLRLKSIKLSFLIFLIAIACLAWAYYQVETKGADAFDYMFIIIPIGSLGTLLFFFSLAGFLLTLLKSFKRMYFKDLNCFILRQIYSNININFVSMSIVCIMLLLSIGALSTGLSVNNRINTMIAHYTPYDVSIAYPTEKQQPNAPTRTLPAIIKAMNIPQQQIAYQTFTPVYESNLRMDEPALLNAIKDNSIRNKFKYNIASQIQVVPLSAYNSLRKKTGYAEITLADSEIYAFSTADFISEIINQILEAKPTLSVYGKQMKISNTSYELSPISTSTSINEFMLAFVIEDRLIPSNTPLYATYWNVDLTNETTPQAFNDLVFNEYQTYRKTLPRGTHFSLEMYNKSDVYEQNRGMAIIFTYIGIYLGIVFMIASAVILALQQLSQANDNKKRYAILSKIGTDKKMINRSILTQIAIYYFMPLALAIVHSIVGIRLINNLMIMLGRSELFFPAFVTGGFLLIIYGSYFLVTYFGYKNISRS